MKSEANSRVVNGWSALCERIQAPWCIALRLCTLQGLILAAIAGLTWSQEDPFGGPAPKAQPGGKAEADPFGGAAPATDVPMSEPKAAAKGKGKSAAPKVEPLPRELERLRASKPATPFDLMRAAQAALQFGRPDETKKYFAELLASKPTDELLAALTTRFGDFLFEARRRADLQPEGAQAVELIFGAAQRATQNAERIESLIARLSDPQAGVRNAALGDLSLAGIHAVNPMLRALADETRAKEHANIRATLVRLAGITELPLVGALQTKNERLKAQIVAVLGRMRSSKAITPLIRPAIDPEGAAELRQLAAASIEQATGTKPDLYWAERHLRQTYERLLAGEMPYRVDVNDEVELWSWDEKLQGVVATKLAKADAGIVLAADVAADLLALKPGDVAAQRMLLLATYQHVKSQTGFDQPLSLEADTAGGLARLAGAAVMNQVLAEALARGQIGAAIGAAELLGQIGDAAVLRSNPGSASPLGEAMRHPDRRVRMAAALAAVKLAPGESFAGASRVGETLGWFAGTQGNSAVLVGHPRSEDAQTLVALLLESRYEAEAVYIGRALAERAFANPDFEMILIADAIDMPPVQELVQWLRRDYRTARQPIGVMARGENLDGLREAFKDDPFTRVFPRLHSGEVAAQEVAKLKAIAGRNLVGRDERTAQAQAALAALTALAKDEANLQGYELLRLEPTLIGALNNPSLSAAAAGVLALLGSPRAQTALVDFASQQSRPLADRQAAAAGFAAAVKARGLLLTQVQIAEQYGRYNASEKLDAETQAVLAGILDAVEGPAVARGEIGKDEG